MPNVSKQHFEMVAAAIARVRSKWEGCYSGTIHGGICAGCLHELAEELAEDFSCQNPRFDRDRFLEACGV